MININLLPPEVKQKIKKSKQSASIFGICLAVVIGFITINFLLFQYKVSFLQTQLDNYKADIINANKSLTNYEDLQKKALFLNDRSQVVTTIQNSHPAWSPVLQDMINDAPSNVQFVSLTADPAKEPNFALQGTTVSERDAIKFKDKLESSSFFKNVVFKSSTSTRVDGTNNTLTFTLEFNLEHATASQAAK